MKVVKIIIAIFSVCCVLLVGGCFYALSFFSTSGTVMFEDLKTQQVEEVVFDPEVYPHRYRIKVKGYSEKGGLLVVKDYEDKTIDKGNVDMVWEGDYYSPSITFTFIPNEPGEGHLEIDYVISH